MLHQLYLVKKEDIQLEVKINLIIFPLH